MTMINKKLLIFITYFSITSTVVAEEGNGYGLVPDIFLQGSIEIETGVVEDRFIGLSNRSRIGLKYKKKLASGIDVIAALSVGEMESGEAASESFQIQQAWIGVSTDDYQAEIGTLKNLKNYMGGEQDDPLNNTPLRSMGDVIEYHDGGAISFLDKSFAGGELVIEVRESIADIVTWDSSIVADLAYRISNDKTDTVAGKIVGGDEFFVLYSLHDDGAYGNDSLRVGGRYSIGNLTGFAMAEDNDMFGYDSMFGSLTYNYSNKLEAILTTNHNESTPAGGYQPNGDMDVAAIAYKPMSGVSVVLGKSYFDDGETFTSISVDYQFGLVIK